MIPWAKPDIGDREEEYVRQALRSTWISGGKFVDRFESHLSDLFHGKTVLACSNGTSALQLAYQVLGLRPGDEVVVPGFGYMAAANVARQMGISPVFADVREDTWCLDTETVANLLSNRTRAVVAIHTYGSACDMRSLLKVTEAAGIPVIEDCAESFGSMLDNQWLGTFGTIGTLSFQATKTISTGEGGAFISSNPDLLRLGALYRSHGVEAKRYWHVIPGNNYRLTNLQAAVGCAQLEQLEHFAQLRRRLAAKYRALLSSDSRLSLQEAPQGLNSIPWTFGVRLVGVDAERRDVTMNRLASAGIETRPGFYTPNEMPGYGVHRISRSEQVSQNMIVLPFYPSMEDSDLERVCTELLKNV
jgi:perosamine synthetase